MNKRLTAILALTMTFSTLAIAGGKNLDRLAEKLNLDSAQQVEFERIIGEGHEARKVIREETKTKFNAIKADQKEQLAGVLTPEQLSSYEEIMASRDKKGKKGKKDKKK